MAYSPAIDWVFELWSEIYSEDEAWRSCILERDRDENGRDGEDCECPCEPHVWPFGFGRIGSHGIQTA